MFGRDRQKDASELVILSLLAAEGPMYGYRISKEVSARSDNQLRLTPGVLYPLLQGLEAEGLILSSWEEVKSVRAEEEDAGRKRKWYRLSAKGRKRLEKQVEAHKAYTALIDAFLPRGLGQRGEA
jgi:PadR family transcriptional regulator, regulatory protein PadR